jgi:hypothetical protein
MAHLHAFIDESGNHDIEVGKTGASRYFLVLAVVVKEENLASNLTKAEQIRMKYFQTGEIKSNSVKDRDGHKRRMQILAEILELNFGFYLVAVDKAAVERDGGLQYKKVFLKFVNGLLYGQLFQSWGEIRIIGDSHGGDDFQESFRQYINSKHKPNLFWQSSVELVESKANVHVQIADFIVGTLAKTYEGKANLALEEQCRRLIKEKAYDIKEWPTRHQVYFPPNSGESDDDRSIHNHSLQQAELFLNENNDASDPDVRLQIAVLRYLVFVSRFDFERDFVSTNELLEHLQGIGFAEVTEQAIRSNIIAKLRDNRVLIASTSRGYKIPKGRKDLIEFAERVNGLVIPLLARLKKARNSFLNATHGEFDLVGSEGFSELAKILDKLRD